MAIQGNADFFQENSRHRVLVRAQHAGWRTAQVFELMCPPRDTDRVFVILWPIGLAVGDILYGSRQVYDGFPSGDTPMADRSPEANLTVIDVQPHLQRLAGLGHGKNENTRAEDVHAFHRAVRLDGSPCKRRSKVRKGNKRGDR